jgi:mannose-6-phosphate isomerase-like protein (cupin superfamily)
LERGIGNPTISVLAALADGMGISMADLVSEHIENENLICRREERETVRKEEGLLLKSVLVETGTNTSLSVHLLELEPQRKSSKGFEAHLEEECLYVLEGKLVMVFENEEFLLHDGDSIRVLSNRLHYVRNDGDAPAFALNIKCKIQY